MEEPRQRQKHFSAPDLSCRCDASVPQHVLKELKVQLDDRWPESVEEQSLLLLVWRHYITR